MPSREKKKKTSMTHKTITRRKKQTIYAKLLLLAGLLGLHANHFQLNPFNKNMLAFIAGGSADAMLVVVL